MKMVIVLALCLALSAASASALQMPWAGLQGLYGPGALMTMMGAGPCAEYLRQPQCSCPAAAPFLALGEQTMWCQLLRQQCFQQMSMMGVQSRCQAMCGVPQLPLQMNMMMMQLQLQLQLQGVAAAASSLLYGPAALMQQQCQQLLPAAQALTPMAMAMAVAQNINMPPAMCGLYQLPSYCATPCAAAAAIPPFCC